MIQRGWWQVNKSDLANKAADTEANWANKADADESDKVDKLTSGRPQQANEAFDSKVAKANDAIEAAKAIEAIEANKFVVSNKVQVDETDEATKVSCWNPKGWVHT